MDPFGIIIEILSWVIRSGPIQWPYMYEGSVSHVGYLSLRSVLKVYHQKESNSMGYENKQIFVNLRIYVIW